MDKVIEIKLDSARTVQIDATNMSLGERQVTVNALHNAELLADAILWVAKKIEQLGGRLFLKPSFKH